jgi:integrase
VAFLSVLQRDGEWIFASAVTPTRHVAKNTLKDAWRKLRKLADLEDVGLHDLRHTAGTYAGQVGNAFLVCDLLGHSTVAMSACYVSRDTTPVQQTGRGGRQPSSGGVGQSGEVAILPRRK